MIYDYIFRMQNNFVKTIETRIIPTLAKSFSKCTEEAFGEWKEKIDESLSVLQNASSNSSHLPEEDYEAKKVNMISGRIHLDCMRSHLSSSVFLLSNNH